MRNILGRSREALGMKQKEMAEALEMSLSTYQRRERLKEEEVPGVLKFCVLGMVGLDAIMKVSEERGEDGGS